MKNITDIMKAITGLMKSGSSKMQNGKMKILVSAGVLAIAIMTGGCAGGQKQETAAEAAEEEISSSWAWIPRKRQRHPKGLRMQARRMPFSWYPWTG